MKQPASENQNSGLLPFWFLNDLLDKKELSRQIRMFKEKCFDGYILHGRSGLRTPYLSQAWFDTIEHILKESKKYGMEVWFYDEEPYPSGAAGGTIVRDFPEARSRALHRKTIEVKGPKTIYETIPWGKILSAKACSKNTSIDLHNFVGPVREEWSLSFHPKHYNIPVDNPHLRALAHKPHNVLMWNAPKGIWRIEVYCEIIIESFKYWGHYTDLLDPHVASEFIERSYISYIKKFKPFLGNTVKGFFIDEPSLSPHGHLPWSRNFSEYFKKKHKYNIITRLPALFDFPLNAEKIRNDYWNVVMKMWRQSFWSPLRKELNQHNLRLIGHIDNLRLPWHNARTNAGFQPWEIYFSPSGCDHLFLHDDKANPLIAQPMRISSTAARRQGFGGSYCEAFACTDWQIRLEDLKYLTEWMTVNGVGRIIPHAAFYSIAGQRKFDAAPSHSYQAAYWPLMNEYSRYAKQLGDLVAKISADRPVAILLEEKQFRHLWGNADKFKKTETYTQLLGHLTSSQVDFDIIGEDDFIKGKIKKGNLCTSFQNFIFVIFVSFSTISKNLQKKINEFKANGGHIAFLKPVSISHGSLNRQLWQKGVRWFRVLAEDNTELKDVIVRRFRDKDNDIFMLVNRCQKAITAKIQWNPFAFEILPEQYLICKYSNEKIMGNCVQASANAPLVVGPRSTIWIVLKCSKNIVAQFGISSQKNDNYFHINLPSKWKLNPQIVNIYPLSDWHLYIKSKNEQNYRKKIHKWITPINTSETEKKLTALINKLSIKSSDALIEFETKFISRKNFKNLRLSWECSPLQKSCEIFVNGKQITEKPDSPLWPDCNSRSVSIESLTKKGKNSLSIILPFNKDAVFTMMSVPLRLQGNFSINDSSQLTTLPNEFEFSVQRHCEYKEFVGRMILETEIELPFEAKTKNLLLTIPEMPSHITGAELFVNDVSAGKLAWSPYSWKCKSKERKPCLKLHLFWCWPKIHIPEKLKNTCPQTLHNSLMWW